MEEFPSGKPVRLRLYVVDSASGAPLANTTFQAHWTVGGQPAHHSPRLRTDANGYISFALYPPTGAVGPDILVYPVGNPVAVMSFKVSEVTADNSPRLLSLDSSTITEPLSTGNLPSLSNPDPIDLLSTNTATQLPHINLGLGLCGKLVPNTLHSSCFGFHLFSITDFNSQMLTFVTPPGAARPNYIARQTFTGIALEMEQCWSARGHSVGQILNSFPLAPCESVSVAILDYTRRERAARNESTGRTDSSIYQSNRDSLQFQTYQGMLKQSTIEVGGTRAINLAGIAMSSGAMGYKNVTQTTAAEALNRVSERLRHSASAVSLVNSMVVMEAQAEERKTLSTRTIGNHNHCHTLTVMYYEVLRNYLVRTTAKRGREVLFIQGPDAPWSIQRAHNFAYLLREVLLDDGLLPCIEALGEALCCLAKMEPGTPCDAEACEACCCANCLVDHLNAHAHYYNAHAGANQDFQTLTTWMIEAQYNGQPLLDVVDPTPLGVFGGYIAFALLNTADIPLSIPSKIQYISLPTKGVFAEGLLGNCNTCEVIEEGVHRDFKDDPCGCKDLTVPAGFESPSGSIFPSSGLGGTTIGNLLSYPTSPFGVTPDLLSKMTELFFNPELLKDNAALAAAKSIAEKMVEELKKAPAGGGKDSELQKALQSLLLKFLTGFVAGV